MQRRSDFFSLEKSDPFFPREINPEKIVDYLQQLGSQAQLIPLAEVMRSKKEKLCFTRDDSLFTLWKEGMASIRQNISDDLTLLTERLSELNLLSATFLAELEQEIHKIIHLSLSRLARLQETVARKWGKIAPPNYFFPALEQFFRNGELFRFQDNLGLLQKGILQKYQKKVHAWKKDKKQAKEIQLSFAQTAQTLKVALNFVLSFYDRKWLLFLSFSQGKGETWE